MKSIQTPFTGSSAEYLYNVFQPAVGDFASQKDLLAALKILKAFGGEQIVPFKAQLYQPDGVLSITTSRSNGQSVVKLMDMFKMYIGYVNPDGAALLTIQSVYTSSQKKKCPAYRSLVSNVSGSNPVKRQRTKDHDYDSTLDNDEESNVANIIMSPYVQYVIASAVKTALLNSAQKADVSKAPEHDDGPLSFHEKLETHFK